MDADRDDDPDDDGGAWTADAKPPPEDAVSGMLVDLVVDEPSLECSVFGVLGAVEELADVEADPSPVFVPVPIHAKQGGPFGSMQLNGAYMLVKSGPASSSNAVAAAAAAARPSTGAS